MNITYLLTSGNEAAFKKYMIFKSLLIHLLIIQSGKRIETQKQHCSQLRTLQNCFRWCTFFIQYIIHIHSNSCKVLAAWIFYEHLLSSKPSLATSILECSQAGTFQQPCNWISQLCFSQIQNSYEASCPKLMSLVSILLIHTSFQENGKKMSRRKEKKIKSIGYPETQILKNHWT